MTKKSTKRALVSSIVSLLICFTMLLGTTFAWFTDSVVSGNNIITAGNLDMKVSYKPYGADKTEWTEVKEDTVIFGKDAKYEPGYTEAVWLKIENAGSLAFKYAVSLNATEKEGVNKEGKTFKLSDYLNVKYANISDVATWESIYAARESLDGFAYGASANSGETKFTNGAVSLINNATAYAKDDAVNGAYSESYVLVIIEMPTTVGNEANHNGTDVPKIDFTLTAVATQVPNEEDSFGSDYDASANYDNPADLGYEVVYIHNLDDFAAFGTAVNTNSTYGGVNVANNQNVWVEVMSDIDMTNAPAIQGDQFAIGNGNNNQFKGVFDGNNHTISNYSISAAWSYSVALFRTVSAGFTMKDITFDNCSGAKTNNRYSSILVGIVGGGTVTFDNVDIKNSTSTGVYGAAAYVGNMTEGALYFIDCDVDNVTLTASDETAYNAMFLRDGYSHHDYEESGVWVENCTITNSKSVVNNVEETTVKEYNYTK